VTSSPFIDIHCHLVPGIDDGPATWEESLAMARMAAADGIGTIVATPHQLGNFAGNDGPAIRGLVDELNRLLEDHAVPLAVLPGADVRIEEDLVGRIRRGEVLSLADQHRHVLLELPHELYFPLEPVLAQLERGAMAGILSHPERNQGLIKQPKLLRRLVDSGCLMQITAGSLMGGFGSASRVLAEWMLGEGLVHFVSTDAHGTRSRRPILSSAFARVVELTDEETAVDLCRAHPSAVVEGKGISGGKRRVKPRSATSWWLGWSNAG
jgi:protein-tyrosine phosphatase